MSDDFIPEDLLVGEPVIEARWRLQHHALPLKNRHLRAFEQRGITPGLASWARQHIEWTLAEGSMCNPNGVLVTKVDDQGRAAMEPVPFEPLPPMTFAQLLARVARKADDAVEDEVIWLDEGGSLVALTDGGKPLSGVNSLVADLVKTLGKPATFDMPRKTSLLADPVLPQGVQAFLASDEYGVVGASDAGGQTVERFAAYYARLVGQTHADNYDRGNLGLFD